MGANSRMSSILDYLEEQRTRVIERLREVQDYLELEKLDRLIADQKGQVVGQDPSSSSTQIETVCSPKEPRELYSPLEIRDQVYRYLSQNGGPVPVGAILELLESKGVQIAGINPKANLSTLMSRDSRFHSNGRDGWVLAESIQPDDQALARAVQGTFHEVSFDPELLEEFNKHRSQYSYGLPHLIDRLLLERARRDLNRHLTDSEKHSARQKAREKLNNL